MEPTERSVVKHKALIQRKRPAPRNQVKNLIFGDLSYAFKLCVKRVAFLVRRRKVPTFKRRVNVVLLVNRFVKALLPTKPSAKPDAPPVDIMLVDNILDDLPISTRSAITALPTTLIEEGLDTEAPVIDMKYALVHDYSVLHKGKNDKWIVSNLDAIQMR